MKENKITIIINKPIKEVFEFTTNPKNTPLWISFIDEEITDEFPPKVGSIYKNRRGEFWNESKVTKYQPNKFFKLENDIFLVEYIYKEISYDSTQLEYLESVKKGILKNSFTQEVLDKLKKIIEDN